MMMINPRPRRSRSVAASLRPPRTSRIRTPLLQPSQKNVLLVARPLLRNSLSQMTRSPSVAAATGPRRTRSPRTTELLRATTGPSVAAALRRPRATKLPMKPRSPSVDGLPRRPRTVTEQLIRRSRMTPLSPPLNPPLTTAIKFSRVSVSMPYIFHCLDTLLSELSNLQRLVLMRSFVFFNLCFYLRMVTTWQFPLLSL